MQGNGALKRFFDLFFCVVIALPVMLIITLAGATVWLNLGRPIFFRQARIGLNEKEFRIIKLRTMTLAQDQEGVLLPDEKRLTKLGKFLRGTSIDELPELWNVFRGEMSLVGPRPLLPEYLDKYTERERKRHKVRPGLTGLAQVNGRNEIDWSERLELDVWYVEHRTMMLDMKILLLTLWVVLSGDGISHKHSVTMPKFRGK